MVCPVCGENLRTIVRSGVEIDICPGCKGIWLDRGELEKLITLEATANVLVPPNGSRAEQRDYPARHRDDDDEHDRHDNRNYERDQPSRQDNRRRQRGSWLGDLLGNFGGED